MMMHSNFFAVLLLSALMGCAARNTDNNAYYGNFVQNPVTSYDQKMADDAATQLIANYPPASTRFDLQQTTPDAFGTALIGLLRVKGYAVLEFKQDPNMPLTADTSKNSTVTTASAPSQSMHYIIDCANEPKLYRLTLLIGSQSLSRAYIAQNGTLYPAGSWLRKE